MRYKRIWFLQISLLFGAMTLPANERKKLGDLPVSEKEAKETKMEANTPATAPAPASEKPLEDDVAEELFQKGLDAMKAGKFDLAENLFDRVIVLKPSHKGAQEQISILMRALEEGAVPEPSPTPSVDPKEALLKKLTNDFEGDYARGDWDDAHATLSKILAIDPENKPAKSKLHSLRLKLHGQAVERAKQREEREDYPGAIDAYRMAQSYWNDPTIPERINTLRKKIKEIRLKKADILYLEALGASQKGQTTEAIDLCKQALSHDPNHFQAQRMLDRLQSKTPR